MKCINCGSLTLKTLFSGKDFMFGISGKFPIKMCTACGLVMLDPQPSSRELKRHYPSTLYYSYGESDEKGFFARLRAYFIRQTKTPTLGGTLASIVLTVPAIPSYRRGGKILDIGCGSGNTLGLLKSIGWNVYGLDIDRRAISIAHSHGLKNVTFGSYEDVKKYPDEYFDVIRLYHVIEHLKNPDRCIALLHKKLKKDGELIIGTPNVGSLISRIGKRYWYNLDCPRHVYVFTPKTLRHFLGRYGFSTEKLYFCSAGGILGTLDYVMGSVFRIKWDVINKPPLVVLLYPVEWILDKFHTGDVFVIHAQKKNL